MPIIIETGGRSFYDDFQRKHPQLLLIDALDDIGENLSHLARTLAPQGKTGTLRSEGIGFDHVTPTTTHVVSGAVGVRRIPRHAIWVHEGTGVFGHLHRPIFSPRGNLMRFQGSSGRWIHTRTVLGQRPQPFLRDALAALEQLYIPFRVRILAERLAR